MNREQLIRYLVGPAALVPIGVPGTDTRRKCWLPSPLREPAELNELIAQHLAGAIAPRPVRMRNGSQLIEREAYGIGAYCLHHGKKGSTCWARWMCLDIDGPDHKRGRTEEHALATMRAAFEALTGAGLAPVIERSHGGKGWHLWTVWPRWMPGGFAYWLGLVARMAIGDAWAKAKITRVPDREARALLESFPKQEVLDDGPGNLVAMPFPGRPPGEGGGTLRDPVDPLARELDADAVCLVADERMDYWRSRWQQWLEAGARQQQERPAPIAYARGQTPQVPLETIARALGEVTDTSARELLMNCPRHQSVSKRSLTVRPEEQKWFCFGCDQGGQGESAPFTFARWLLPSATDHEVFDKLRSLARG